MNKLFVLNKSYIDMIVIGICIIFSLVIALVLHYNEVKIINDTNTQKVSQAFDRTLLTALSNKVIDIDQQLQLQIIFKQELEDLK